MLCFERELARRILHGLEQGEHAGDHRCVGRAGFVLVDREQEEHSEAECRGHQFFEARGGLRVSCFDRVRNELRISC